MQEIWGAQQTWIFQRKIQNEWISKILYKDRGISTISLNSVPHIEQLWEAITTEWVKNHWNKALKIQSILCKPVQGKGDSKPWHQGL